MALVRTAASSSDYCVAVACGRRLLVATRTISPSGDDNVVKCHQLLESGPRSGQDSQLIKIANFSPDGENLLAGTTDKHITLWKTSDWSIAAKRVVSKRGTAVQFTPDNRYLIMSDKSGDVLRYALPDLLDTDSLFLGHSSMLLDMVLIHNSASFLVTCDRDEKIRVSHFPNCYNIQTYCLGHTHSLASFLKTCKPVMQSACTFSAASLWLRSTLYLYSQSCDSSYSFISFNSHDGSVRLWKWYTGQLLHTELCFPGSEDNDPKTVNGLVCSRSVENPLVVVSYHSLSELLVYRLVPGDQSLIAAGVISLTAAPWCIDFDWQDRLWVCLHDTSEPLQCYDYQADKFCKISPNDEPILGMLGKWPIFSECVGMEFDWDALRPKQEYDNMSAYLAAKEDRIRELAKKRGQQERVPMEECSHAKRTREDNTNLT